MSNNQNERLTFLNKSVKIPRLQFYNDSATLAIEISADFSKVQFSIAQVLDGQRGRPEKGQQKFNYDRKAAFSMSVTTLISFARAFDQVRKGTYANDTPNEKFKTAFQTTNFRSINGAKKPSYFTFHTIRENGKAPKTYISISPPKEDTSSDRGTYVLNNDEEILRLKFFVEAAARYLDFVSLTFAATIKKEKMELFDAIKEGGEGGSGNYSGGGGGYQKNNNYQRGNYQGQQRNAASAPPPPEDDVPFGDSDAPPDIGGDMGGVEDLSFDNI